MSINDETRMFEAVSDVQLTAEEVLVKVYKALKEKGYDPINQIVGYLTSNEPAFITNYNNARDDIRRIECDELIEELVKEYVKAKKL